MPSEKKKLPLPPLPRPQRCLWQHGTTWYLGAGAKDRMKSEANRRSAECLVQLQNPDTGWRRFGCYSTWPEALRQLRRLSGPQRHLFELIPHGRRCKPYLDLDGPPLPCHGMSTLEEVIARGDRAIRTVFSEDYGVELVPERDVVWLASPQANKLSLHVTVSTHAPQLVFRSNHKEDPQGAYHLASRVKELDPDGVGALVDLKVYSKDRELRCIGASKYGKPGTAFLRVARDGHGHGHGHPSHDALVTCLDPAASLRTIQVPPGVSHAHAREPRGNTSSLKMPPQVERIEEDQDRISTRMLDLVRDRVHPTAFHNPTHGAEAP